MCEKKIVTWKFGNFCTMNIEVFVVVISGIWEGKSFVGWISIWWGFLWMKEKPLIIELKNHKETTSANNGF